MFGQFILETCTLTLREINLKLQQYIPHEKNTTKTIDQILNGLIYTVKDTIVDPYERNCQKYRMFAKNEQNFFL